MTPALEELSREQLLTLLEELDEGGIHIQFSGKANARGLARRVRPRVLKPMRKYSCGSEPEQARNLLVEGDNLQAMATLYRQRGQVDLILTDPPYNTGNDWRYNDRWEDDPNDPGLGSLVSSEDRARHTKWMRFMWPRLQMMKSMLKPGGVLAICIDHRELFRLGQMLDELFREQNRLAIINWQKSTAPRNDSSHVSTATEYVLIYAKDHEKAQTAALPRSDSANSRYRNPDQDPEGVWREHDLSARTPSDENQYGIQSPFTGKIHYPPGKRSWSYPRRRIKSWLEEWGSEYTSQDLGDGRAKALTIKAGKNGELSAAVPESAERRLQKLRWPFLWFGMDGQGGPRAKRYLNSVKKGMVPITYWADEDMDEQLVLDSTSWNFEESGLSQSGIKELAAVVGKDHDFNTVKPLKLFTKIIQLWCPSSGLVLDPFAGSGTSGHAVLNLNAVQESSRRFILIEQGRPEKNDSYARSLTANRLKRVISGKWAIGQQEGTGGGFRTARLDQKIDAEALLKMEREELTDTLIASHFDHSAQRRDSLIPMPEDGAYQYLVARTEQGEGVFLVWRGATGNADLDEETYDACVAEAAQAGLDPPYHVYARLNRYQANTVVFYQIPDRILMDFGLSLSGEPYFASD